MRHSSCLADVIQILEYIQKHLPRVNSFVDLFVVADRIEQAICYLYRDLIQFSLRAANFLKRNPICKPNTLLLSWPFIIHWEIHSDESTWPWSVNLLGLGEVWGHRRKKFHGDFQDLILSIHDHTQWIDAEANVGLHILLQQTTIRNHREVLSSINSALAAPAVQTTASTHATYRSIPHVANGTFFGRSEELKKLHDALVPDSASNLTVVSIVGEGGVGKSQLALHFTYTHFKVFSAIFWVAADGPLKIAQAYEAIAKEVGLQQATNTQSSLGTIQDATLRWLSNTSALLVPGLARVLLTVHLLRSHMAAYFR
jgi:hypothetical protein